MSAPGITPSALPRLSECLGSVCLPHSAREWEDASRGRALHAFMEAVASGETREAALAQVPEKWRMDCEAIEVPEDWTSGLAEVGLALDLARGTARLLGHRMTRESVRAAREAGEMGMLLDWLAQGEGVAVVRDLKTGWQEDLSKAQHHLQLLTYASAALLALQASRVVAELWHWTGTRWYVDRTELDFLGAVAVLEEVRALTTKATKARGEYESSGKLPTLTVGDHCTWCPSRHACPALVAPALAVLGEAPAVVELTPESAGTAYVKLRQAQRLIKEALDNLKRLARSTPLVLPGGKVVRLEEEKRRTVDVDAALPILAQVYGEEVAGAAVKTTRAIPWTHLQAVLKEQVLPGRKAAGGRKMTAAALALEARTLLEAEGAVRISTHAELVEVRPELVADGKSGNAELPDDAPTE